MKSIQDIRDRIGQNMTSSSTQRLIFNILIVLILIKSATLRYSVPGTPFIDADIEGYLGPALDMLSGKPLVPECARGIYYPLFSWFNISISGSLNGIAFTQHLLGLIGLTLIVFSFNSLLNDEYPLLKKGLVLLSAILLGFNCELISYEHRIRPEGLLLFLSGSIFFFLRREYTKPGSSPFLLGLVLTATAMMIPKFALGCAVIGAYITYRYIIYSSSAGRKWLIIALTLSSVAIILSLQFYLNGYDENSKYFLAKNFFYVNSRTIHYSGAFEKHFSFDEKQAIETAINEPATSSYFPILGFNPDISQYGPAADKIEKQYGKKIYRSVMVKSLKFCVPVLFMKMVWQALIYDFSERPNRMSLIDKLDYANHIADSQRDISALQLSHRNSKIVNKYINDLNAAISKSRNTEAGDSIYKILMYRTLKWLSPFILFFFIFYSLYAYMVFKDSFLLMLLFFHSLSLLIITLIHTIDMLRYCISLFPFFVFILIPGLYYFSGFMIVGFKDWRSKSKI